MDIFKHPFCTQSIGAPTDMPETTCSALPVATYEDEHGHWTVSYWLPTAGELQDLNKGGCVALHVRAFGRQHPVVSLGTESARPRGLVKALQAPKSWEDAFEEHRIAQSKILGMPGLRARPCYKAGYDAALTCHSTQPVQQPAAAVRAALIESIQKVPAAAYVGLDKIVKVADVIDVIFADAAQPDSGLDALLKSGLREILASAQSNSQWYITDMARHLLHRLGEAVAPAADDAPSLTNTPLITLERFKEKMDALDVLNPGPLVAAMERSMAAKREEKHCTCPSGSGSLTWPCPAHPPAK